MKHKDQVGDEALHQIAKHSESDPGAIGAYRAWLIPSTGALSVRNATNTGWIEVSGGGGGGVTDHGALTGLADDDHTQYYNSTRHTLAVHTALGLAVPSDISGAISTHEAASDPHTGYQKESEKGANNGYAALDAGGLVPVTQIGSGTPNGFKFLRDDRSFVAPPSSPITIVTLGSDVTGSTTANAFADVTGLSFSVVSATTYNFDAYIIFDAPAATTGSKWAINGPASPTLLAWTATWPAGTTSSSTTHGNAYDVGASSTASAFAASNLAQVRGIITPSASGTVVIRFASELGSSAIVAKAGSTLRYW